MRGEIIEIHYENIFYCDEKECIFMIMCVKAVLN